MKKTVLLIGNYYNDFLKGFDQSSLVNFTVILSKTNPKKVNNSAINIGVKTILVSTQDELYNAILNISPEVIISIGWRKILPKRFFNLFKNKTLINIHPAILPDYKGFHTEPYVIMNNETFHGITAHELTPELDGGRIILQKKFQISKLSTVKSIKYEVEQVFPVFFKNLINIVNSNNIIFNHQIGETKIIAPKRTPEDSEIDASLSLMSLYNTIRAFDPETYPAFFIINGEKIFIRLWSNNTTKKTFEL